ncbi:MAG: DUF3108 domain-containing protein [Kordiimonadaceae bacterium]|jgi:hypothetical protein|nr:DUF3108 domain-containing protein [Kordiimonadaceae bacterium]
MLSFVSYASAQDTSSYKATLNYKAYWAGFTVANITSETTINHDEYKITANYEVGGIARMFSKSANNTLSRGIKNDSGEYRPTYYESIGNFGKLTYLNQVKFDPKSLKVIEHTQELNLRDDLEYIPIAEEEKYGADPLSIFLNMTMNKNFNQVYKTLDTQRQFGGIFVSEQTFICEEQVIMEHESRSVFEGEATVCAIDGKLLAGSIKRTNPKKKRRKSRVDDDQKTRLWFGKLDGFEAMAPVYTEFPIGWGKVRIYLSDYKIEPIESNMAKAENLN